MKISNQNIIIGLVMLFFYSCKCTDISCPGFDEKFNEWLPYSNGDVVKYINDSGSEIEFTVSQIYKTETKTLDCSTTSFGGCRCPDCPEIIRGSASAYTTDTSRKIVNAFGHTVATYSALNIGIYNYYTVEDSNELFYSILDCSNRFKIVPVLKINAGDSLLPMVTFGGINYNNVVMHQRDTTVVLSANPIYNVYFVWKSYYNKQFGIIAFEDLKANSLFYRKP